METHKKNLLCGLLAFLFTVEFCWGQEYKLEYKFTKGELLRYKQTTQISKQMIQPPAHTDPRLGLKQEEVKTEYYSLKVEEVNSDGTADAIRTQDSVITKVNLKRVLHPPEEAMNGFPLFIKISTIGTCTEIRPAKELPPELKPNFESIKQFLRNQQGLPAKTIKVGDSWENSWLISFGMSSGNADVTLIIKSTLVGFEKYMGLDCAKIQDSGALTGTTKQGEYTLNGKIQGAKFFAHELGKLIKQSFELDQTVIATTSYGNLESRMKMVTTQELLK